jgi:hypothetical protein
MGTTATIRNGIDVDRLLETIHAIEADPVQGSFTFSATSTWSEGTHNIGQIQGFTHAGVHDTSRSQSFTLEGDEPPVLLGNNTGPKCCGTSPAGSGLLLRGRLCRECGRPRHRDHLIADRGRRRPGCREIPGPGRAASRTAHRSVTAWPTRSRSRPPSTSFESQAPT